MPRKAFPILLVIAAVSLVLMACLAAPSPRGGLGALTGRVSIGPLCPVEPCPNPPQDIYASRSLTLQPKAGESIRIPLGWDGSFRAEVRGGTYTVNLTDCVFLGCQYAFPRTVTVKPGEVTTMNIELDTGIR